RPLATPPASAAAAPTPRHAERRRQCREALGSLGTIVHMHVGEVAGHFPIQTQTNIGCVGPAIQRRDHEDRTVVALTVGLADAGQAAGNETSRPPPERKDRPPHAAPRAPLPPTPRSR